MKIVELLRGFIAEDGENAAPTITSAMSLPEVPHYDRNLNRVSPSGASDAPASTPTATGVNRTMYLAQNPDAARTYALTGGAPGTNLTQTLAANPNLATTAATRPELMRSLNFNQPAPMNRMVGTASNAYATLQKAYTPGDTLTGVVAANPALIPHVKAMSTRPDLIRAFGQWAQGQRTPTPSSGDEAGALAALRSTPKR